MYRPGLLLALVAAGAAGGACGSLDDDRPETLQYIQAAIIQPTCAKAQCHSSFAQEDAYNFGTFRDTQIAMVYALVIPDINSVSDQTARESFLIQALTVGVGSIQDPGTTVRMPYDEPMPIENIDFLEKWITDQDELGLGAPGAQCVPNDHGVGCTAATLTGGGTGPVPCSPEGNVTSLTPTTTCASNEMCEIRSGTCVAVSQ